jgi:hypothetical protein
LRQKDVAHLKHIDCVHIIVVLYIAPVAFVNLTNEARKLHLIQLGKMINFELFRNVNGDCRESSFATQLFTDVKGVEFDGVRLVKNLSVLSDVLLDRVYTGRSARLRLRHCVCMLLPSLLLLLDVSIERGLSQDL